MIERFNSSLRHVLGCLIGVGLVASPLFASDDAPVLKKLKKISTLSSTVPSNGDVNPYGLVRVPNTIDRKSTRLNSSHVAISYAVFCLKKKPVLAAPRGREEPAQDLHAVLRVQHLGMELHAVQRPARG